MTTAPKNAATGANLPGLLATVAALLAPGRGILAADESLGTIGKRFAALGIPATEENRLAYRGLLFTTPGLQEFITGVILFDETIRQRLGDLAVPEGLVRGGLIPGIKVDAGTVALPGFSPEKITEGLDGLRERLASYRDCGARFTKWRAVVAVGEGLPSAVAIAANARALARFAALSQEAGLVPIVEPEVLMDGAHGLDRGEEVAGETLRAVFAALADQRVVLEGMLLKTAMVLPGRDCPEQVAAETAAEATLRCLRRNVPAAVPGIVFLSGGQTDVAATGRLNAICRPGGAPWQLCFSFGRALQDEAMKIWSGSRGNVPRAQAALLHRACCNGLAVRGGYSAAAELAAPQ